MLQDTMDVELSNCIKEICIQFYIFRELSNVIFGKHFKVLNRNLNVKQQNIRFQY